MSTPERTFGWRSPCSFPVPPSVTQRVEELEVSRANQARDRPQETHACRIAELEEHVRKVEASAAKDYQWYQGFIADARHNERALNDVILCLRGQVTRLEAEVAGRRPAPAERPFAKAAAKHKKIQAQTTYSAVRGATVPRFDPLQKGEDGATTD